MTNFRRSALPFFSLCLFLSVLTRPTVAQSISVSPGESIQAAINSATAGDIINVAPGSYFENIDFLGKAITVRSTGGAGSTIIDGGGSGPVALFTNNESRAATLSGFTLQNGLGGVSIRDSSPTVTGNIISNNNASSGGGGVAISGGAALISDNSVVNNRGTSGQGIELAFTDATVSNNTIRFNTRSPGFGGVGGGGISIRGAGNAQVLGNFIDSNVTGSDGGGISLFAAGNPAIIGNTISNNSASSGGGISHANRSDSFIAQNLIIGNTAGGNGGGVDWLTSNGSNGPRLINNTIALNSAGGEGSAIFADGFDQNALLANNILFGIAGENAVGFGDFNDANEPTFLNNIIYSPNTSTLSTVNSLITGANGPIIGVNGNIGLDPQFVDASNGNFELSLFSGGIDAGTNQFLNELPQFDFNGNARLFDFDEDGFATIDIGAFEATAVPEPTSFMLLLPAVVALFKRRRQSA